VGVNASVDTSSGRDSDRDSDDENGLQQPPMKKRAQHQQELTVMLQPAFIHVNVYMYLCACKYACLCICVCVCVWGSAVHGGKQVPLGGGHTKQSVSQSCCACRRRDAMRRCAKSQQQQRMRCVVSALASDFAFADAQVQCLPPISPHTHTQTNTHTHT